MSVLKVFGKIDFHYAGEITHPSCMLALLRKAYTGAVTLKVKGDHVNFSIRLYNASKSPSFGCQS